MKPSSPNNQQSYDFGSVDLNTQIRLSKVPTDTYPKINDIFQIVVVPPVPTDNVQEGYVVVRNMFISIDATNRVWISGAKTYVDPVRPGDTMKGFAIGEVIFTKGKKFDVGTMVMGMLGWQKYAYMKETELTALPPGIPNPENFLGVYGISGLTAYFGMFRIGKIKEGETVVVSAAAGAVGEIAVQLAKDKKCRVIGIAGGKEKCEYVKKIGADAVIDYKSENVLTQLKKLCPKGIDVYFDNVGGQMLDDVLMNIRDDCRIVLCGTISSYNEDPKKGYRLKNYSRLIIKRGTMQGFLYFDYRKQFSEAITYLMRLVDEKKLTFRVDMMNGLEEAPRGLQRLLTGENNGKVIVKVIREPFQGPKL